MTTGNLSQQSMTKESGSVVTGFCPFGAYTTLEVDEMLQEDGKMSDHGKQKGKKGKRKEACQHVIYYYEQCFLGHIIECINSIQESGPILVQVGSGENAQAPVPCIPVISFISSDNEGGNKVSCVRSCKGKMPCRCCEVTRPQMYNLGKTSHKKIHGKNRMC